MSTKCRQRSINNLDVIEAKFILAKPLASSHSPCHFVLVSCESLMIRNQIRPVDDKPGNKLHL